RILPIRFLFTRPPALNLRCVSNPQLKLQLSYQSFEPARLTAGFHAHSHLGTLCRQLAIEPLGFLAMLQSSLPKLATLCVKQPKLLKLGVKICSYNDHCSAPFSRVLVGKHHQSLLGRGSRHCHGINYTNYCYWAKRKRKRAGRRTRAPSEKKSRRGHQR